MEDQYPTEAVKIVKEEGVKDLTPMQVKLNFAKALKCEREAGHTTPEAETYLQKALDALQ